MSALKRHFKVIIGNEEYGLYTSSTPSLAAKKAVSKLCADNKNKKVEFSIRETTQGSSKKIYGPYLGYMQKLDKPIELKGRVIRYKPIAKLKKKSRKMKGGVILGIGAEGVVIHPNINSKNDTKVSKLIEISPEKIDELIEFEQALNDNDKEGQYHVRMILEESHELPFDFYNMPSINQINKNKFRREMNQREKNNNRKIINPNFKITYEYGGISIEQFLDNFEEYSSLVNPHFIQALLRGILNCFQGLYVFYSKNIVHSDLHRGNIVFLLKHPEIMRMIDWGNLLVDNSNLGPSSARNFSNKFANNAPSNSAPSSAPNFHHNSSSNSIKINNKMKKSLCKFYTSIRELLNQIKYIYKQNKELVDLLDKFLNIPNFFIYKSKWTAKILSREELDGVRGEMDEIISKLS